MKDLVEKALPNDVNFLMGNLDAMNMNDKPPTLFECQLKLFSQWFEEWSEEQRDLMLETLESHDPVFAMKFRECVKNPALLP